MEPLLSHEVPLAPLTTLELGGPARYLVEAADEATVSAALDWARGRGLPVFVLGGGSNLVVADAGFPGLVIRMTEQGVRFEPRGGEVLVEARAGGLWDALVTEAVARDLAGIECLAGIPGSVGATPVQNVGAYGQEVGEVIRAVRVLERETLQIRELAAEACAFGYRDSAFKRDPDRYVVLSVTFALRPGGAPAVRYGELRNALATNPRPTLAEVREVVLGLRRAKSMVFDQNDPNRRSAGSFFTNPVVSDAEADRVVEQALAAGLVRAASEVPRYPAGPGRSKLAAGWLVERAGIAKGFRLGSVGVSTRHALALVHHGGGTTADLLRLATHVRDLVQARFGVALQMEPVILGAVPGARR